MQKTTNKTLNHIAPPPPPPPPIISSYIIEETLIKTHSLTQAFLAKIPKLALFSAFWGKLRLYCGFRAPLKGQKSAKRFFSHVARHFHTAPARFPRKGRLLAILLLTATLGLTHCSSDDNGGGGGANNDTPDTPSCTPSPKELWTATLTVGERLDPPFDNQRGYSSDIGALSDTQFTRRGIDYVIDFIISYDGIAVPGTELRIKFESVLGDTANAWMLDLGPGRSFAVSDGAPSSDGQGFIWSDPGFLWADRETHTVKLIGNTCDD